MPRLRNRTPKERGWTDGHKSQLRDGWDFLHTGWGNQFELPMDERDDWPPPEVENEMRSAWEFFRDDLMVEAADTLARPWAWWEFEFPELFPDADPAKLRTLEDPHFLEAEPLDRLGLLTDKALADAAADPMVTRGTPNDAHNQPFRRGWGWWKFTSPERRDYSKLEAVQLVDLERRGGEVLTQRERHLVEHKSDIPAFRTGCALKVRMPRAEVEALELPSEFIEDTEDTD